MKRNTKNQRFYFTYGSWESYPYHHGWTEVSAPTRKIAIMLFRAYHPHPEGDNYINCANIYTEKEFINTEIYLNGNGGFFEVEVIDVYHEYIKEGQGV